MTSGPTTNVPHPLQVPLLEEHQRRRATAQTELTLLDKRSSLCAHLRSLFFFSGAIFLALAIFNQGPSWSGWAALGCAVVYAWIAVVHNGVIQQENRRRLLIQLNERAIARITGMWRSFPHVGSGYIDPDHPYVPDLDIFGQGSLFQLLDETTNLSSEKRLAKQLAQPAPTQEIPWRQKAIADLAKRLDFRQALSVESRMVAEKKPDPSRFIDWTEGPNLLSSIRWTRPLAWLLPLTTFTLFLLGRFEVVDPRAFWGVVLLQLGVALLARKPLNEMYSRISMGEQHFVHFEGVFQAIEKEAFESDFLRAQVSTLKSTSGVASESLKRFSRLFSFAELRQSGQVHAVVQLFTLWDIHWLFQLEKWRTQHGAQVRPWFDVLFEIEALSSLAALAHARPQFVYPNVESAGPKFVAQKLGHPLIDAPIPNDVSLPNPGHGLIVTGSNMSGKSTLLRAMGINTVLALAGAPVCAESFSLSSMKVLTSMRVKDSLERGISYFFAEVRRLKLILDEASAANGHALFLLDEILLGTNARERQIASQEILRLLLSKGACGAVATHDVSLCSLEDDKTLSVRNVHFKDHLEKNQMVFDYTMRPGIVDSTNALRVLQLAGINISKGTSDGAP